MRSAYSNKVVPWLLLSPSIFICILFLYYPMLQIAKLSLYKVAFFGMRMKYVGLENFIQLFSSPVYLGSILTSLVFSGAVVVLGISISMGLALLANQKVYGARFFRVGLIWPYALSPAIAGIVWLYLFNPAVGVINYTSGLLFGIKPQWYSHRSSALIMVITASVWKALGYNIIFLLAGLQNIPGQFLEAAKIDGASTFQRFWKITLPLLSPTIFFLLVMNLVQSFFTSFGLINVMTEGGPREATNILIYQMYTSGFRYFKSGFASAQSLVLFAIVIGLTLMQFKLTAKRVHYQGG